MAYTLGNLVTRVQNRIRDTGYSSTEIKNLINDTQNDVFNEYRLPFMQATQAYTLTAGDADLTSGSGLPANYVQALDLTLTSSGSERVLAYASPQETNAQYPDATDTSAYPLNTPYRWYEYAQTINLFPVPNEAYTATLRYYKKPTLLSSDDDVPEIPGEFEELLVLGASYRALQIKDNYDQAAILQNKYDEILQKMVVKYSQPQVGTPLRMRINRYAVGKTNY